MAGEKGGSAGERGTNFREELGGKGGEFFPCILERGGFFVIPLAVNNECSLSGFVCYQKCFNLGIIPAWCWLKKALSVYFSVNK